MYIIYSSNHDRQLGYDRKQADIAEWGSVTDGTKILRTIHALENGK